MRRTFAFLRFPAPLLALLVGVIAACGGNVVVDAPTTSSTSVTSGGGSTITGIIVGTGNVTPGVTTGGGFGGSVGFGGSGGFSGVGGSGGFGGAIVVQGVTSGGGFGGGSAGCPPTPGGLTLCGGTGSTGGGSAASCEYNFCQSNSGDMWTAVCSGSTCQCQLNNDTLCGCTVPGTDLCSGSEFGCCFGM